MGSSTAVDPRNNFHDNGVDSHAALAALTAEDLPALGLKLGQMALVRRLINTEPTASSAAAVGATAAPPATALSIVRTLQVCSLHSYTVFIYAVYRKGVNS